MLFTPPCRICCNAQVQPSLSILISQRLTANLINLNSFLNPILGCWKIKEIRYAVKRTFQKLSAFSSSWTSTDKRGWIFLNFIFWLVLIHGSRISTKLALEGHNVQFWWFFFFYFLIVHTCEEVLKITWKLLSRDDQSINET